MTNDMTGPAHYRASNHLADRAQHYTYGDGADPVTGNALATEALVHAVNAQTAMMAQLIDAVTGGHPPYEMDAWREVIPRPPLKECRGKENRRPACIERHTDDCTYADPPPEPKHVLLDVGTRVLVAEKERDREGWLRYRNPVAGRISGYDMHKSKYRYRVEYEPGIYADHDSWAFVGNHVEVHPDGPECPPPPKPVKREPTAPLVYVQHIKGHQGYIIGTEATENGDHWHTVRWFKPGSPEERLNVRLVHVIAKSELERCDNGQTREECTEADLCVACEQDRDEEGDAIEESMGLR